MLEIFHPPFGWAWDKPRHIRIVVFHGSYRDTNIWVAGGTIISPHQRRMEIWSIISIPIYFIIVEAWFVRVALQPRGSTYGEIRISNCLWLSKKLEEGDGRTLFQAWGEGVENHLEVFFVLIFWRSSRGITFFLQGERRWALRGVSTI